MVSLAPSSSNSKTCEAKGYGKELSDDEVALLDKDDAENAGSTGFKVLHLYEMSEEAEGLV